MDPEQTFLRVHARLSGMLLRVLTPKIRTALEYLHFAVAVALFCSLVVMHTNFVQQPGCSAELSKIKIGEADLIHIKISSAGLWSHTNSESSLIGTLEKNDLADSLSISNADGDGFQLLSAKSWLNWIISGLRKTKLSRWKSEKEFLEPHSEYLTDTSGSKPIALEVDTTVDFELPNVERRIPARELLKAAVYRLYIKCCKILTFPWGIRQKHAGSDISSEFSKWLPLFQLKNLQSLMVDWLETRGRSFEPTYMYTAEKGYFWLSEEAKLLHDIKTVNVTIPAQHSCFGNRWQQLLINSFIGYDTILMNSLLSFPGQGYLYNFQTREIYDLGHPHEQTEGSNKFEEYVVAKCGVLIMSLFVFFTTTMSVSFTLRETQSRMLKFTVQLQHHARHRLPTFQLVFVHVIESLVFVPIMIGTLFFLFEFYDDQLLAFMVLILVWLCELFTLISVRTPLSIQFFPRFFLLYFLVFHIYFFSYAYGFSYLAFATTAAFMYHLILYFWNRFEVPALERYMWNRQQPGIHITSSILTSTVHIARVNMRNPVTGGNEFAFGPMPEATAATTPPGSGLQQPATTANTQTPNSTQTNGTPTSNSVNPFSSLLLGILGGIPDGHVSFFSLFRDMREPGQVYDAPPQQEQPVNRSWWSRRTS